MLDILNKINYPTTKFDDGLVINADCLEVLKQLPDESIDIILTDPPYNIGYAEWDLFFNIPEVTAEWYRVLKPNDSIFCFVGWSFVCQLISDFDKQLNLTDWIIYDRIKDSCLIKH